MSWLRLRHTTVYHYSAPVQLGPHRLVLRPREGHDLRVDSFSLRLEPAGLLEWSRDIFGNSIARVTEFAEPTTRLTITSEAILWRSLADPSPPPSPPPGHPPAWPVVYEPLETAVADAYRAPVYPDEREPIVAWLREGGLDVDAAAADTGAEAGGVAGDAAGVASAGMVASAGARRGARPAPELLGDLCERIRREIGYGRRDEKGVFSPAQTLALRSGSCRDMATLFLEAGRALGFAMRFASGYLECAASRAGQATTHAWVEAYLPELGWRGYDATSGRMTTASHIVTGVSRHPRGVMPVSGVFRGEGAQALGMTASVFTEELARPAPADARG